MPGLKLPSGVNAVLEDIAHPLPTLIATPSESLLELCSALMAHHFGLLGHALTLVSSSLPWYLICVRARYLGHHVT
jgi:hypothetical protein